MNNFIPQGMPEDKRSLAERKWEAIIFRLEEIEGKVIKDSEARDNIMIRRCMSPGSSLIEDIIIYKKKPILKIKENRVKDTLEFEAI